MFTHDLYATAVTMGSHASELYKSTLFFVFDGDGDVGINN